MIIYQRHVIHKKGWPWWVVCPPPPLPSSKYFADARDHAIPLSKFERYGILRVASNLITSTLQHRKRFVYCSSAVPTTQNISSDPRGALSDIFYFYCTLVSFLILLIKQNVSHTRMIWACFFQVLALTTSYLQQIMCYLLSKYGIS